MADDQEVALSDDEVFGHSDEEVFGKEKSRVDLTPLEKAFDEVAEGIEARNQKIVAEIVSASMTALEKSFGRVAEGVESNKASIEKMHNDGAKAVREIIMEAVGKINIPAAPDMAALGAEVAKAIRSMESAQRELVAQVVAANEKIAEAMKALAAASKHEPMPEKPERPVVESLTILRDDNGDMKTVRLNRAGDAPMTALAAARSAVRQ